MNGKIHRLPSPLREQLNRRLDNNETAASLIAWLHSLPEVLQILAAHFEGQPLTPANITNWKKHGFRRWKLRQTALRFATELAGDNSADRALTEALSEKLAQWAAIRYAVAADALTGVQDEPQAEMHSLRDFCADITTLRRGDLSAGRLALERQRLDLLKTRSDAEKDAEFWQWTKRADIQARLYPHRDPDKIRRDVDRMISGRLLGIPYPDDLPDESEAPAALI